MGWLSLGFAAVSSWSEKVTCLSWLLALLVAFLSVFAVPSRERGVSIGVSRVIRLPFSPSAERPSSSSASEEDEEEDEDDEEDELELESELESSIAF